MNILRIPKRNGSTRLIYSPSPQERQRLNELFPKIALVAEGVNLAGGGHQHGFQPNRSPVTNALAHVGFAYTLNMDLSDFFDSVTPNHVPEELRFPECFPDGAARQGLPTSPALANIAACKMDRDILAMCPPLKFTTRFFDTIGDSGSRCVYTRYADDLTFSSDHIARLEFLRDQVPIIAAKHGFKVNPRKTKIQAAVAGRRIITGVAVDANGIHPTRHTKRKLRAAKHQRNTATARGLLEWMQLRKPKPLKNTITIATVAKAIVKAPVKAIQALSRAFNFD